MIYLIRHTRVSVPAEICYGQSDVALADSFEEELAHIKSSLCGIDFSRVYSSPLERCRKLALGLCDVAISPMIDNRLMEMNFGNWEGVCWDDIYADEYGRKWFDMYDHLRCPEGESFRDMLVRVSDFLDTIHCNDDNILIVTHAGVIRSFKVLTEGISIKDSFNIKVGYGQIFKIARK